MQIRRLFQLLLLWLIFLSILGSFSPALAQNLLTEDFADGDFAGWTAVDDGTVNAPSAWSVSGGTLGDSSQVSDGNVDPALLPKRGTFVWYEGGLGWTDYRVGLTLRSQDQDALGVMFRYQDPDNYYRFSWDRWRGYRRLVKVVNGTFTLLAEDSVVYTVGQTHQVDILANGDTFELWVDGVRVFVVLDGGTPLTTGSVGLYSWENGGSFFDNVQVATVGPPPPPPPAETLTVSVTGDGTVTSSPGGIACPGDCTEDFPGGQTVTLTATPAAGSVLTGWSGDCSGTGSCVVPMSQARAVTAVFDISTLLLTEDFADGDFAGWTAVDDGTVNAPSAWSVSGGTLGDSSQVSDGNVDPALLPKRGTFVWYEGGLGWTDYRVGLTLRSQDQDALGVMFRYQDPDNYYRFSWDRWRGYRRLVKVVNGTFTLLAEDSVVYTVGQTHQVDILANGDTFELWVDGVRVFVVLDGGTPLTTGSVGLYSWENGGSFFDNVQVATVGPPPPPPAAETLTVSVTGDGTVTSSPGGIACPGDCTEDFPGGQTVTLTATPAAGSVLTGWSGDCSGTGSCVVPMSQARAVTAAFDIEPPPPAAETLTVSVTGDGTVTSSPGGIACPGDCTEDFPGGQTVTLTATPAAGSVLTGWSGDCSGTGSCVVPMSQARAVTAAFDIEPPPPPAETLTVSVTGDGTVTSSPGGIACPGDCTEDFPGGQTVTLTATPAAGSVLTGWSGDCSGTGSCVVPMSQARAVTAVFDISTLLLTEDFADGDFAGWTAVDDGTVNAPSAWSVSGGTLGDSSQVSDGNVDPALLPKRGTFVWYEGGLGWTDYRVGLTLRSQDQDALGVMFRYQDPDNYYRFSWDRWRGYRRLVKVVNGTFTLLAEDSVVYTVGQTHQVDILANGDTFELWVDGVRVFVVLDGGTPLTTGSVGLYSWENGGSFFDNVQVATVGPPPPPPPAETLTVSVTGDGTVTSSPGGIACPGDCTEDFPGGQTVTLTATPAAGSVLTGWSGDCSGTGSCVVPMSQARAVTAAFDIEPPPPPAETLTVSVTGDGTVTSSPGGIACPGDCTEDFPGGQTVTLTATPAAGSVLTGWSGDCSGTGSCVVPMSQARAVTAVFDISTLLLTEDFADGDFAGWTAVDDGTVNAPSAWSVSGGTLGDSSQVSDGNVDPALLPKRGTFVWYEGGLGWTDYRVGLTLRSQDQDALGVMFRYQDPDNYYRFSWDRWRGYRRLVKVVNGTFTLLAEDSVVYTVGQTHQVDILANGDTFELWVDGVRVFVVLDGGTPLTTGSVGLYSWENGGSFFDNVQVATVGPPPPPPAAETLTVSVTGDGTVTSSPGGIACPGDCTEDFPGGQTVTLTATPAAGSVLTGWSGDCSGTGSCVVPMSQARAVTAVFDISTLLLTEDFADGDFAGWTAVDDGTVNAPSAWSVSGGTLGDSSQVSDGNVDPALLPKRGTFVWYEGGLGWTDYRVGLTLRSQDQDALGVMFRYQDPDNYYRFSWDRWRGYRRLVKVVNGTFTLLAEDSVVYTVGQTHQVDILANGDTFELWVDGVRVFVVLDGGTPLTTGSVGLYSWENGGSFFDNVQVATVGPPPPPPPAETLTVSVTGDGTVTSSPGGIACPGDCTEDFPGGQTVTLTATPAAGSVLTGWSGDCSGTGSCVVPMSQARAVTAAFDIEPPPPAAETLTVSVTGDGTVTSSPGGIACPGDCTEDFPGGQTVTLTATPAAGSVLTGWSGDCSGTGSCVVPMSQARAVTAVFDISTLLLTEDFADGDFAGWTAVDDGTVNAPSAWSVSGGTLGDSSQVSDGNVDPALLPKRGTFVWYEGGLGWTDYRVGLTLRSQDQDALGVMFRYQDPDNYYRFSWDRWRGYRRLVKVVNGTFTLLAEDSVVYTVGQTHQVDILANGDTFELWVDGVRVFVVLDGGTPLTTGSVGLYSWENGGSFFDNIEVVGKEVKILSPQEMNVVTSPLAPIPPTVEVLVTTSAIGFPTNWGVEFVVDGDDLNAVQDYVPPFELVTNLIPGEHTVTVHMIDEVAARQTNFSDQVNFGVGDSYVAFGDSITYGASHDTVSGDNVSADGRNSGGGFPPILNDLLTNAKQYPHSVENEGISGEETIDGVNRIANVLATHPNSNFFLILFGTNDSFLPIPSGMGLMSNDPGYPGTYKDNIQQIITAIVQAGKVPLLAKVPIRYGDCGSGCSPFPNPSAAPANLLIQEYNAVVDELVVINGIEGPSGNSLTPPDHFTYFEGTPVVNGKSVEFDDFLHPNGVGLQSMANLWLQALTP